MKTTADPWAGWIQLFQGLPKLISQNFQNDNRSIFYNFVKIMTIKSDVLCNINVNIQYFWERAWLLCATDSYVQQTEVEQSSEKLVPESAGP